MLGLCRYMLYLRLVHSNIVWIFHAYVQPVDPRNRPSIRASTFMGNFVCFQGEYTIVLHAVCPEICHSSHLQ